MHNTLGSDNSVGLNKIKNLLIEYQDKLSLTNVEMPNKDEKNYICFAHSKRYGEIVLKFGTSHWELVREAEALRLYNGNSICKCFEVDLENDVLILERINPGYNLHAVSDVNERIEIYVNLLHQLTKNAEPDVKMPKYRDLLDRTFRKASENVEKYFSVLEYLETAKYYFQEIEAEKRPQYMLHGDLNHRNILKSNENWVTIDPLGVIGEMPFETARFIRNELRTIEDNNKLKHLDVVLNELSEKLGEEKARLAKAMFVDQVSITCWYIEIKAKEQVVEEETEMLKLMKVYLHNFEVSHKY